MAIQAPKGMKDVTPQESYKWQYIESLVRDICLKYGFKECRTPVLEHTELFLRGVGDTTDIVQKEMYTFTDKGGRSVTLKPEGTAGAVRMFLESGLFNEAQPTKMYYLYCPVYRYEQTQMGRLREHHQFGVEVFGASHASADAECIFIAMELFRKIGLTGLELKINSIGCPECRPKYHDALRAFLGDNKNKLCQTCNTRLNKNPLRVLDCKENGCKDAVKKAPVLLDYLCASCKDHMQELTFCLEAMNVQYEIDPFIVRGLDYYTKTVFEIITTHIGSQGTVCGGGRYDGLVEEIGGPKMHGMGFGMGMERLLLLMQNLGLEPPKPKGFDIYLAGMGEEARKLAFTLCMELREKGLVAECDHVGRSLKAQMKYADKINAGYVAVIGEREISESLVKLKNMQTGEETEIALSGNEMANYLIKERIV